MSTTPLIKEYTNGDITIVWQPDLCIHSAICRKGLPQVFDPGARPWVNIKGAEAQAIVDQVSKCPSGALSIKQNKQEVVENETIVEVAENGPILVYGNLSVKDKAGNVTKKHKVTAFCRCGASGNKPYCDGTHRKIGFSD